MKPTLTPGLQGEFRYTVPLSKTVPYMYEEAPDFQLMPAVFATGYMVALCEWACIELIKPHLDWPAEQTLGVHVNLSHLAATPPGLEVTVSPKLIEVDGRRLKFEISAHDGIDTITQGTHERAVIDRSRFESKLESKRAFAAARYSIMEET